MRCGCAPVVFAALDVHAPGSTMSATENAIGAGMAVHAVRRDLYAGVGDVELAGGVDRQIIEKERLQWSEVDGDERRARVCVEAAQLVDVEHPERVALHARSHGGVELHVVSSSLDEVQAVHCAIGGDARDEAVAVLHSW